MDSDRRQFLAALGSVAVSAGIPSSALSAEGKKATRVVLLGTKGGPRVSAAGRRSPSTLLVIDDVPYVVDCGYGTSVQLTAAGVALNTVGYIRDSRSFASPAVSRARKRSSLQRDRPLASGPWPAAVRI